MDQKETYLGENIDLQKKKTSREYIVVVLLPISLRFANPDLEQRGHLVPLYMYDLAIPPS